MWRSAFSPTLARRAFVPAEPPQVIEKGISAGPTKRIIRTAPSARRSSGASKKPEISGPIDPTDGFLTRPWNIARSGRSQRSVRSPLVEDI